MVQKILKSKLKFEEAIDVNAKERQCFGQYGQGDIIHKFRTPLYYAVANKHTEVVRFLVDSNAIVTSIFSINPDQDIDLFELADAKGHKKIMRILLAFVQSEKLFLFVG